VAEVLLFHHAQGLTPGVLAFADDLRSAGHVVHTPDLYGGATFPDLDTGVGFAKEIGVDTVIERGRLAAQSLPDDVVHAGFSLGVMPAQMLAQTRPGARGALLLHGSVPLDEFGGGWPQGLPLQIHTMENDDWGDVDVGRELAATIEGAELFVYPGDVHLFTDNSLAAFDEGAAALVRQRVLGFLDGLG
jgi:dienelactone hydrolase